MTQQMHADQEAGPRPPTAAKPAELRRHESDQVIGGVCSGIARYAGVDPVLVRVAAVVLALASGVGVLAYIVAWIVIPADDGSAPTRPAGQTATVVLGAALVLIGLALLADQLVPNLDRFLWPSLLVGGGIGVVALGTRR